MIKKISNTLLVLLVSVSLSAQSGYYWSQNFGLHSSLLSGSTIAGAEDNAAFAYNPGANSLINKKAKFSINLISATQYLIKQQDVIGLGNDTRYSKFDVAPRNVALTIQPFKKNQQISMFVGAFRKNFYNIVFTSEFSTVNANQDVVITSFQYEDILRETWIVAGVNHRIDSSAWSIGGSLILIMQNRNYGMTWSQLVYDDFDARSIYAFSKESLTFFHKSRLTPMMKLGVGFNQNGYKFGLTANSPAWLRVWDSADVAYETLELAPGDSLATGKNYVNNKANGRLRYPLVLGAGITIPIKSFKFNASVEYFFPIASYNAIYDTSSVINDFQPITNYANDVFNAAIGLQYHFAKKDVDIMAGARTNFLSKDDQITSSIFELQSLKSSRMHVSLGTIFNVKKNVFSLGVDYGFEIGKEHKSFAYASAVDLNEPNAFSTSDQSKVDFHAITFFIGYEIGRKTD